MKQVRMKYKVQENTTKSYRGHGSFCLLNVTCCQVDVSVTSRSPTQRSPADCGVWFCVTYKRQQRGCPGPRLDVAPEEKRKRKSCVECLQHSLATLFAQLRSLDRSLTSDFTKWCYFYWGSTTQLLHRTSRYSTFLRRIFSNTHQLFRLCQKT